MKTVNDDEPEEHVLTLPSNQWMRSWPEDDLVVFEHGQGGATDLWMFALSDGQEARPYLELETDLDDVIVSPDGAWAAYQSAETGTEEVYVRAFPDARQQIAVSEGEGQFPRWSEDGGTLYYWRGEFALVDTLYAATVRTEPTFAVLSQAPVLTGSYLAERWDLHPDGDRIVVAADPSGDAGEVAPEVIVVENFFEELKERVGG